VKYRITVSIAVFVCTASAAWSEISMTTHANPKNGPIWKICVLPPETAVTRIGMKGGSNLQKESDEWATRLSAILGRAIVRAGGTVAGDMSAEALQRDDETRQAAVRLRKKYDTIGVQMLKKPGGVEKGRYTLGDEVALLPCARQADALAFVDGRILLQTPGRKAFDVVAANLGGLLALQSRYDIWLSLVDARTGQVIAFIHEVGADGKTDAERDESFSQAFAGQLQRVHVGWVRPDSSSK
jgi:hypothetical protein